MLQRFKISLYVRVLLVIIPCLIYLLARIFIINDDVYNRDDDKTSAVFASSQRRLLGMSEDSKDTNSQHDASIFNEDHAQSENLEHYGSLLGINKSKIIEHIGADVVRRNGRIIILVLMSCYCFWMLAIICDEYFIASINIFCDKLNIKHELASGTFMTMATSSPEFCISCVGTFISKGNIGIGTIVGSAIFNILIITACCGILTRSASKVDVYLLSRDCIFYAFTIIGLIAVIYDHLIMWHEAALMVVGYGIYLIMMYNSDMMSRKMNLVVRNIKIQFSKVSSQPYPYYIEDNDDEVTEITPLFFVREKSIYNQNCNQKCSKEAEVKLSIEYERLDEDGGCDCATNPWKLPRKSNLLIYVVRWPIAFVLWCTVPDCRRYERFYIVTFVNCVAWILGVSYLFASMIANVDSIMGMIFLGACTSIPEAVSSVLATFKGNADIGINNAISSNIFDILLCLGLPWCARTMLVPLISGQQSITLTSTGITYSAISLLATLFIFYFLFIINRFMLDKKIGVSCLIFYLLFLIFTSMLELNVFLPINFPTSITASINGLI